MSTYSRQRDSRDVRVPRNDRNDFIQGRGQRDSNTSKSKSRPYESRPYESSHTKSEPRVIAPRMQMPVPVPVPVAPVPVPIDVLSEADLRILDAAPKQLRIPRVFMHHTSDYIRKCFNQYIATIEADASNVQLTQCEGYQTAVIVVEKWRQTQTVVEICRKLITNERDNKIIHGPNAAYWFIQPVITSTSTSSAHKGKGSGIRKATLAHHYHDALDKMAQLNMENVELRERNAEMMELLAAHGIRYQPDMIYTQHCRDQAADKLMTIEELELAEEDSITTVASDTDITIDADAQDETENDDEEDENIVVVV